MARIRNGGGAHQHESCPETGGNPPQMPAQTFCSAAVVERRLRTVHVTQTRARPLRHDRVGAHAVAARSRYVAERRARVGEPEKARPCRPGRCRRPKRRSPRRADRCDRSATLPGKSGCRSANARARCSRSRCRRRQAMRRACSHEIELQSVVERAPVVIGGDERAVRRAEDAIWKIRAARGCRPRGCCTRCRWRAPSDRRGKRASQSRTPRSTTLSAASSDRSPAAATSERPRHSDS